MFVTAAGGCRSGNALPEEICALTDLEELSWRGALPCDDGDDYTDEYDAAPDQAQRPFTLPKGFGRLRMLRVLKLDCWTSMTELPPQVRAALDMLVSHCIRSTQ